MIIAYCISYQLHIFSFTGFEDVIEDLGQVLKISHADRLYTKYGKEIKSFSHLRNDFKFEDTFIVSAGPAKYRYLDEDGGDVIGGRNSPPGDYESSDYGDVGKRGQSKLTCYSSPL